MLVRDIMNLLESKYTKEAALDFDNVGLLVGCEEKEVHRIYIALDATDEVIAHAVTWGADLLITHHPMIFHPLKNIRMDDFIGRRVITLVQNDISYYAMHTNYDVLGMAQLSGNIMELTEQEVLEETYFNSERPEGIGRVGMLPKTMNLEECCSFVKEKLKLETVKVFADFKNDKMYRRLAISPGSGKGMIEVAVDKKAEIIVTGDMDHHAGIDAVARGITVIDAGHYGTEYIFMEDVKEFLVNHIQKIELKSEMISQPCHMI